MGSDNESDNDLLDLLIGNDEEPSDPTPETSTTQKPTEFNFLDAKSNVEEPPPAPSKKDSPQKRDDHSSDEEDKDYFDRTYYTEFGRDVKDMLNRKDKDESQRSFTEPLRPRNDESIAKPKPPTAKTPTPSIAKPESKGLYNDPVFGLGITKPLVSSAELLERMQGRKAVTICNLKAHTTSGNTKEDWVVAGVVINKSNSLVSQKGSQYCIWKLSDLSMDMKTVSLFLFSDAYKTLWKTSVGAVIGVLNPNVLENRDKDESSLSVDNPAKVMIIGTSRDMGICKSRKKNGDPCAAIVNIRQCEYCVYHVKQEYKNFSRRPELHLNSRASQNIGSGPKKTSSTRPIDPFTGMPNFVAVKSKRNEKTLEKDRVFLEQLRNSGSQTVEQETKVPAQASTPVPKMTSVVSTRIGDTDRLSKLRNASLPKQEQKPFSMKNLSSPSNASLPKREEKKSFSLKNLSSPANGSLAKQAEKKSFSLKNLSSPANGFVDLSAPISKQKMEAAKLRAMEYVRKNGFLKSKNPNDIHPNKDKIAETNKRKKLEEEQSKDRQEKKARFSKEFTKLMNAKSSHTDLIEQSDIEAQEKYFNKLEVKEKMEEKMLTTFKVDCKAVVCRICKYTAFSSSDLCKQRNHPIRVIDAIKRFFKCGNCSNRTVCLDRMPALSCTRCNSSNWVKTGMMDERRVQVKTPKLSIRGDEEKNFGSASSVNLNLIVPD